MNTLTTDLTPAHSRIDDLTGDASMSSCDGTVASDTLVSDASEAVITVIAASSALAGEVDVTIVNGPADADHAAYVALVRRFADHLLCYATEYEAAWLAEAAEQSYAVH